MRFVITLDTALRLTRDRALPAAQHSLLAPTLLRSQILSALYAAVRAQAMDRTEAQAQLAPFRALNLRLLGDRVLQKTAWDIAAQLGWDDTAEAEYLALTRLQADALVSLDPGLAARIGAAVLLADYDALLD